MSKIFTTKKGTALPLMNLKGKDYMMVAYRIQWFTEEVPSFLINTEFLVLTDDQTVCKATIEVLDENGKVTKRAVATKRETKKDFSDHTEKAETGSLGRALIELGFGTQFALSDMDEGMRLADSPLEAPKKEAAKAEKKTETKTEEKEEPKQAAKQTGSRFKPKAKAEAAPAPKEEVADDDGGWD